MMQENIGQKITRLTRYVFAALVFSVISACASGYIVYSTVQVAACERGNKVRKIISDNSTALHVFISQAVVAREADGDTDVANGYRDILKLVKESPPVDCGKVIK